MRAIVTVTFDSAYVDASYYSEPTDMTLAEWRKDWAEGVVDDIRRSDSRASYEVVYELTDARASRRGMPSALPESPEKSGGAVSREGET